MARRRVGRVRRAAMWAGLVVCLLIVAAWCVSTTWAFGYEGVLSGPYSWYVIAGSLVLSHWEPHLRPSQWTFEAHDLGMGWWPEAGSFDFGLATPLSVHEWYLPLWMPFVLVGISTAWLWFGIPSWLSWRPRPGHCPCGYSLAGLAPGAPCPECGKVPA